MTIPFEITAGQIIGRQHQQTGKNNQDALYWEAAKSHFIGIVCDGCGSCAHSEVGAQIGTKVIAAEINRMMLEVAFSNTPDAWSSRAVWETIRLKALAQIDQVVCMLGDDRNQIIHDNFLFTVVGFLITLQQTVVFAVGDGMVVVNEQKMALGPFPGNAPPYMAYALMDGSPNSRRIGNAPFQIVKSIPTDDLKHLLIGTDGVWDLQKAASRNLPGKKTVVGPLNQFYNGDRYFQNPDFLRRRLALINRDSIEFVRDNSGRIMEIKRCRGVLPDDTTMIVVRRKP